MSEVAELPLPGLAARDSPGHPTLFDSVRQIALGWPLPMLGFGPT